jgi:hypothetical protein
MPGALKHAFDCAYCQLLDTIAVRERAYELGGTLAATLMES